MDDDDFVERLVASDIPLHELDHAFAARSGGGPKSRFNVMLSKYWKVPLMSLVSSRASLVGRRSEMTSSSVSSPSMSALASLKLPARKSEASCLSAPLPLDAYMVRSELVLE